MGQPIDDLRDREEESETADVVPGHTPNQPSTLRDDMSRNVDDNKYDFIRTLSEGSYGDVHECIHALSGQRVAIKRFKTAHLDPQVWRLAMREVKVLRSLPPHPNTIQLRRAVCSQSSGRLFLVFELMERSLLQELHHHPGGCLPGPLLKIVAWQLLKALDHCHQNMVVHRDVKPANVLIAASPQQQQTAPIRPLDSGSPAGSTTAATSICVKLCDFGFARWLPAAAKLPVIGPGGGGGGVGGTMCSSRQSTCDGPGVSAPHTLAKLLSEEAAVVSGGGSCSQRLSLDQRHAVAAADGGPMSDYVVTRWYRAPEILISSSYGTPVDIWSYGCTLAELATGTPLFPGSSSLDQLWRICRCLGPLPAYLSERIRREDGRMADVAEGAERGRSLAQRIRTTDPQLLQMISACLCLDPRARPTARELLSFPYFSSLAATSATVASAIPTVVSSPRPTSRPVAVVLTSTQPAAPTLREAGTTVAAVANGGLPSNSNRPYTPAAAPAAPTEAVAIPLVPHRRPAAVSGHNHEHLFRATSTAVSDALASESASASASASAAASAEAATAPALTAMSAAAAASRLLTTMALSGNTAPRQNRMMLARNRTFSGVGSRSGASMPGGAPAAAACTGAPCAQPGMQPRHSNALQGPCQPQSSQLQPQQPSQPVPLLPSGSMAARRQYRLRQLVANTSFSVERDVRRVNTTRCSFDVGAASRRFEPHQMLAAAHQQATLTQLGAIHSPAVEKVESSGAAFTSHHSSTCSAGGYLADPIDGGGGRLFAVPSAGMRGAISAFLEESSCSTTRSTVDGRHVGAERNGIANSLRRQSESLRPRVTPTASHPHHVRNTEPPAQLSASVLIPTAGDQLASSMCSGSTLLDSRTGASHSWVVGSWAPVPAPAPLRRGCAAGDGLYEMASGGARPPPPPPQSHYYGGPGATSGGCGILGTSLSTISAGQLSAICSPAGVPSSSSLQPYDIPTVRGRARLPSMLRRDTGTGACAAATAAEPLPPRRTAATAACRVSIDRIATAGGGGIVNGIWAQMDTSVLSTSQASASLLGHGGTRALANTMSMTDGELQLSSDVNTLMSPYGGVDTGADGGAIRPLEGSLDSDASSRQPSRHRSGTRQQYQQQVARPWPPSSAGIAVDRDSRGLRAPALSRGTGAGGGGSGGLEVNPLPTSGRVSGWDRVEVAAATARGELPYNGSKAGQRHGAGVPVEVVAARSTAPAAGPGGGGLLLHATADGSGSEVAATMGCNGRVGGGAAPLWVRDATTGQVWRRLGANGSWRLVASTTAATTAAAAAAVASIESDYGGRVARDDVEDDEEDDEDEQAGYGSFSKSRRDVSTRHGGAGSAGAEARCALANDESSGSGSCVRQHRGGGGTSSSNKAKGAKAKLAGVLQAIKRRMKDWRSSAKAARGSSSGSFGS